MATEKVRRYICRDCGADYTAGSVAKSSHAKARGCSNTWKTVTVEREKAPSRISYNLNNSVGRDLAERDGVA